MKLKCPFCLLARHVLSSHKNKANRFFDRLHLYEVFTQNDSQTVLKTGLCTWITIPDSCGKMLNFWSKQIHGVTKMHNRISSLFTKLPFPARDRKFLQRDGFTLQTIEHYVQKLIKSWKKPHLEDSANVVVHISGHPGCLIAISVNAIANLDVTSPYISNISYT